MAQRIFTPILLLCSTSVFVGLFDAPGRSQFVPADQAFAFDFQQNQHDPNLARQTEDGYYLYRGQIRITPEHAKIADVQLPWGVWYEDEFYGRSEIHRDRLTLPVTINQANARATLTITYQGYTDAGFCYPPETKAIPLSEVVANNAAPQPMSVLQQEQPTVQLPLSALWALLIGIGIALTPCVLLMYPLISGIMPGGKQRLSIARTLLLIFIYMQGMALAYTALGLVVATAGLQFQAVLQHPYMLIGLVIVFTLLVMSMFGLFTLQLPSSLQTRLALMSDHQQGSSPGSVFVMGAIAGLICSPYTTAPLSAILLYITQSGSMWPGGGTLYLYALSMDLPLMLVTVFGNRLLSKGGPQMEQVKTALGFVILALSVFLLERVIGDTWGLRLWSALDVAFFGWAFITSLQAKRGWMRIVQVILLVTALVNVCPLQDWVFGATHTVQTQTHLGFTQIKTVDELNQTLVEAKDKPVILDLYADWCVACKEFERYISSNSQVQKVLTNTVLLQVNVTASDVQDTALLKHFNVLSLPAVLFFDGQGQEHPQARVTGFMDAETFSAHLRDHQS